MSNWADGFRLTASWLIDMFAWFSVGKVPNLNLPGVLILDEVEQHLHPSMQNTLMTRLETTFPNVQILATTHSPLVALGVNPNELVSLKTQDQRWLATEIPEDLNLWSVSEVYRDPDLFDSPLYSSAIMNKLGRYRALTQIGQAERSEDEANELRELARELRELEIVW